MNRSRLAIETSYGFCHRTARRAGSNFYPCFWVLRRVKRRAMEALYTFMRHTDDLADNPRPVSARRDALAQWRASLTAALCGHLEGFDDRPGDTLLPALADSVERFQIPAEHLHAVIDGVEMDLDRCRYETFDELAEYCHRVASAVGLACIHVWGFRDERAFEPARRCGLAFQMTNILRDLGEDARQDRVYLPMEDLRRFDYSAEDLIGCVADERFVRLMEFEVDRAEGLYREGIELFDRLEPDGQRIFGMMTTVYHRLLTEIAARRTEVLRRRLHLTRRQKLAIAARWLLLPPRRPWLR